MSGFRESAKAVRAAAMKREAGAKYKMILFLIRIRLN
jgi:hypothetical protein